MAAPTKTKKPKRKPGLAINKRTNVSISFSNRTPKTTKAKKKSNVRKLNKQLQANQKLKESKGNLGKQYESKTNFGLAQQHFQGKTFNKYSTMEDRRKSVYSPTPSAYQRATKEKWSGYVGPDTPGLRTASGRERAHRTDTKAIVNELMLKRKRAKSRKKARSSLSEKYG